MTTATTSTTRKATAPPDPAAELRRWERVVAALEERARRGRFGALMPVNFPKTGADPDRWLRRLQVEVPLREAVLTVARLRHEQAAARAARWADPAAAAADADALADAEAALREVEPAYRAAREAVYAAVARLRERAGERISADGALRQAEHDLRAAERSLAATLARREDVHGYAAVTGHPVPPPLDLDAIAAEVGA